EPPPRSRGRAGTACACFRPGSARGPRRSGCEGGGGACATAGFSRRTPRTPPRARPGRPRRHAGPPRLPPPPARPRPLPSSVPPCSRAVSALVACSPPRLAPRGGPPMEARAEAPAVAVKPERAPPARGSALAPVDEAWVEGTLRALSPREKAGQLVLAWISGR